ncbi:putative ribonuclease H-like domain-containing protein [Tanacetum coccineum]
MSQPANDDFSQHLSDGEESNHEDASDTGTAPKQQQQVIPQTTAISNIKLPILKKEEYDIWAMEMEHYLEYIDNEVWKVIQNGNSKKRISIGKDGVVRVLSPVTAAEIQAVEKERKAKNILLMAIPKEHMRRFHGMDDAKEIWEAIRTRFGGNANSKKMQKAVFKQQFEAFKISNSEGLEKGYDRFQQLLSQLEAHGAEVSTEDANHKFLRFLPSTWSNLAMTMRTNPEIDNLSIDDLYNNLRVFEQEIQGALKTSSSAQNVAFVSQSKSSTNKVKSGFSGAYSSCTPSTSSTNILKKEVLAGFADEVIYSLFAKQTEDFDLLHEDLEQINDVDIEEMDINWQIAMIAIRMKKFYKKTGRRVHVDGKMPVGFDKKKLECFNCHNTGHFARECTTKGIHDGTKKRDSLYQHQEAGKQEKNQMGLLTMMMGLSIGDNILKLKKQIMHLWLSAQAMSQAVKKLEAQLVTSQKQQLSLNEKLAFQANEIHEKDEKLKRYRRIGMKAVKEKEQLQKTVDSWKDSSKNLWRLINSGMSSNDKLGLGFEIQSNDEVLSYEEEMNFSVFKCSKEDSIGKPSYSRFTKTNDFKGVPPPLSGDYTPKPQEEIDDSLYVYGKKGPQKPEISVSDDNSSEHSTCQSNDSEGSCGNTSEHSFETESESLSEPNEMSKSRRVFQKIDSKVSFRSYVAGMIILGCFKAEHTVIQNERKHLFEYLKVLSQKVACLIIFFKSCLSMALTFNDIIVRAYNVVKKNLMNLANKGVRFLPYDESKEVEPSCVKHVKTPRKQMKNQGTSEVKGKNWNKMMERELGGYSFIKKKCFVCGSLSHLIKDCDYYKKKMAREAEFKKQRVFNTGNRVAKPVWTNANRVNHANQFVPRSVQLNAGRPNINSVRPNINTGRTNVNSVRPRVNTGSSNVNTVRSRQPVPTRTSNSFSPKRPQDHPLKNMEDRGIFDSGCSGHMTGNKDHLDDFEECKGGSVTFGGSKGYITGKGRIKVGNLEFDSVSFVKELGHFNLFSISQICDKQHKVLFTETECLVVTPDFKMPDENQILLKVPRQHNMYSFDMKTPGPAKSFACLIAKATSDESKLWHRRTVNDHPLKNMEDRGIFDSGCSGHMTGNKDHLDDFEECKGGSVTFGGSKGYITGKGRIRVGNLDFDSVSFVKELGHFNLFSISQICDKQHKVLFTETECLVVSPDFKMPDENQILLKVPRQHNMYSFDMKTPSLTKDYACLIAKATSDESKLWHRRLGHINFKNLNKLVKGNLVRGLPSKVFKNDHTCVACQKGKQHRASCKAKLERMITEPLHTLHMDLFGPTSVKSINHASYCLVITDDCTRFSWVFFLATKDETSGILQNFIRQIENQLNHRVKIIRSDNGTEFKNRDMLEFCGNKGIKQEYSNARTPQQNGVAERMNRTLIEAARTMLADSLLPTTFWAEAVSTACYIFNRVTPKTSHLNAVKRIFKYLKGKPNMGLWYPRD